MMRWVCWILVVVIVTLGATQGKILTKAKLGTTNLPGQLEKPILALELACTSDPTDLPCSTDRRGVVDNVLGAQPKRAATKDAVLRALTIDDWMAIAYGLLSLAGGILLYQSGSHSRGVAIMVLGAVASEFDRFENTLIRTLLDGNGCPRPMAIRKWSALFLLLLVLLPSYRHPGRSFLLQVGRWIAFFATLQAALVGLTGTVAGSRLLIEGGSERMFTALGISALYAIAYQLFAPDGLRITVDRAADRSTILRWLADWPPPEQPTDNTTADSPPDVSQPAGSANGR